MAHFDSSTCKLSLSYSGLILLFDSKILDELIVNTWVKHRSDQWLNSPGSSSKIPYRGYIFITVCKCSTATSYSSMGEAWVVSGMNGCDVSELQLPKKYCRVVGWDIEILFAFFSHFLMQGLTKFYLYFQVIVIPTFHCQLLLSLPKLAPCNHSSFLK
jgi:hypothetical protein